ncbi:MAG: hypothetical protein ACOYB2_18395 [Limnohabitans sp.]|jgi:hypothetical protein
MTKQAIHRALVSIWLVCGLAGAMAQQSTKPTPPNYQRYEVHQSFQGSAYFKDDNIWIYNREFADTFGMPLSGVAGLKGAAAAAFRVETMNYRNCGFGGQDDRCMTVTLPMLDIYIDENKTPLPWATEQQADWLGEHSSVRWLHQAINSPRGWRSGAMMPPPKDSIPNSTYRDYWGSLRPHIDAKTKQELVWYINDGSDRVKDLTNNGGNNYLILLAYRRKTLDGLTVLSFQLGTSATPGSPRELTLRLQAPRPILEPSVEPHVRVVLPSSFVEAMKALGQTKKDADKNFYRSLFKPPSEINSDGKSLITQ